MTQLNVTALRAHLRDALTKVASGESIEITQDGQVVAVLMHPEQARTRRRTPNLEAAAQVQAMYKAKRDAYLQTGQRSLATVSPEVAQGLLDELRRHRSE